LLCQANLWTAEEQAKVKIKYRDKVKKQKEYKQQLLGKAKYLSTTISQSNPLASMTTSPGSFTTLYTVPANMLPIATNTEEPTCYASI
jgi:hypothetical protein